MNIGQMDRKVQLEQPVTARQPNGEELTSWQVVATVYAEKKYDRGSEAYQADQKTATQKVVFRIRWRAGVTTLYRLLDTSDGQYYQVDAISEIGRKQGWLLSCFTRSLEEAAAGSPGLPPDILLVLS